MRAGHEYDEDYVAKSTADEWAYTNHMPYIETSAKAGTNIAQLFDKIKECPGREAVRGVVDIGLKPGGEEKDKGCSC
jgi:hypothetical protein